MKTDFLFVKPQEDKFNFDDSDLIELKPYGLSLNNDITRPFLILKDESGENVLPVGISPIEAGISLAQSNTQQLSSSPHAFVQKLIDSLDIEIDKCVFVEIVGNHQYVRVFMKGHPKYQSLKMRADEAMSLCLHLKTPLFATKSFINKSKVMSTTTINDATTMSEFPQMHSQQRKQYFH